VKHRLIVRYPNHKDGRVVAGKDYKGVFDRLNL